MRRLSFPASPDLKTLEVEQRWQDLNAEYLRREFAPQYAQKGPSAIPYTLLAVCLLLLMAVVMHIEW